MKFQRMHSTMEALREREAMYAEDMAGLFLDLCRDIQDEMQIAASKLPVHDAEAAALSLCQMGNLYLYMIKAQESTLALTEKTEQLEQLMRKVQEKTARFAQAEKEGVELKKIREQLLTQEAEQKRQEEENAKQRAQCEVLRRKLDSQETVDLAAWEREKEALQGEYERQREQTACFQREKEELEEEEKQLRQNLLEVTAQVEGKKREVAQLEQKWEWREREREELNETGIRLQEKLENLDFSKETAYIEDAERYAARMIEAWNAASRKIGIIKQSKGLDDLETEMNARRQQMEKGIESYRERMEHVICALEEAWEE